MANQIKHQASVLGVVGDSNDDLHVLANLYHEPFDSESILSVIVHMAHRPEVKWQLIHKFEGWLTSIDRTSDGKLVVASMDGEYICYDNMTATTSDLGCPDGLNAIWAADKDFVFTVGVGGEIVRIRNTIVDLLRPADGSRLNAVHGFSSADVYVVGDHGRVIHFDGKRLTDIDVGTNCNLLTVLCSGESVYIAGTAGFAVVGKAGVWTRFDAPNVTFTSLAYFKDHLYAAAGVDGVLVENSGRMDEKKKITVYRLRTVGDDLLFAVGNRLVAQFDGAGWWGGDIDL